MSYVTGTSPTHPQSVTGMFIPEVFSTKILDFLKRKLVILPLVSHDYQDDLKIGYKVNIPVISEPTAYVITPGSAITVSNMVGTPCSLTVNQWYGAKTEVSEMADIQDKPDYLDATAEGLAYAIAKQIDTSIGALFATLSSTSGLAVYGADGQTFTEDLLIEINEGLDEADVPTEGRVCVSDPSVKADALKIEKFTSVDYVKTPVVPTGMFGSWFDLGVYFTNNLAEAAIGHYGCIFHKRAMAAVVQKNIYSERIPEPLLSVIYYQCKAIWGVAEIDDYCGRPFYTRKM